MKNPASFSAAAGRSARSPRRGILLSGSGADDDLEGLTLVHQPVGLERGVRHVPLASCAHVTTWQAGNMQTIYEAAGGAEGLLSLAGAWHARVMADEVVSHAFHGGFNPDHTGGKPIKGGSFLKPVQGRAMAPTSDTLTSWGTSEASC